MRNFVILISLIVCMGGCEFLEEHGEEVGAALNVAAPIIKDVAPAPFGTVGYLILSALAAGATALGAKGIHKAVTKKT